MFAILRGWDKRSPQYKCNAFLFCFFFFTNNYFAEMTEEKKDRNFFYSYFSVFKIFFENKKKGKKRKTMYRVIPGAALGSQNI